MLRDKIEVTVKRRDADICSLKIKMCVISTVIVSKHYNCEASCQLPVLLFDTHTFIINISKLNYEQHYSIIKRH